MKCRRRAGELRESGGGVKLLFSGILPAPADADSSGKRGGVVAYGLLDGAGNHENIGTVADSAVEIGDILAGGRPD